MALFSWGEKERTFNQGFEDGINSVKDRETAVRTKEREQAAKDIQLAVRSEKIEAFNKAHDDIEVYTNTAKFELTKADFALEKASFEITKQNVANDKMQLDKKLAAKDTEWQMKMDKALNDLSISDAKASQEIFDQKVKAEARAEAKDLIIDSQKGEIARLDELLKVTMAKLTQIDIKGLTIHVESAKGKQEEKKN